MGTTIRAVIVVPLLVALLLCVFSGVGYFLGDLLGIPLRLGLPLGLRLASLLPLAGGFGVLGWVFKHRSPLDVLISTYVALVKHLPRAAASQHAQRTEPLVITGPHRFVRHPLYSGVILLVTGWWLVLDYTFVLFCAGFLALWFSVVVAPFEERGLRALFGAQYEAYAQITPRFFPSIRTRGGKATNK